LSLREGRQAAEAASDVGDIAPSSTLRAFRFAPGEGVKARLLRFACNDTLVCHCEKAARPPKQPQMWGTSPLPAPCGRSGLLQGEAVCEAD